LRILGQVQGFRDLKQASPEFRSRILPPDQCDSHGNDGHGSGDGGVALVMAMIVIMVTLKIVVLQ
jgi:hypothetical protein